MVSNKPNEARGISGQHASLPDRNVIHAKPVQEESNRMEQFIRNVQADLKDLKDFYNISISETRLQRFDKYLNRRINELITVLAPTFKNFTQDAKVDFLLIRAYLKRLTEDQQAMWSRKKDLKPLLGSWASDVIELCERRQNVVRTDGKYAADVLTDAGKSISNLRRDILSDKSCPKVDKFTSYLAAQVVDELRRSLDDWYSFYNSYDPTFSWWVSKPWEEISEQMQELSIVMREHLAGITPGDEDAIVGQPSGRESILADLESEMIPYSPEELLDIAKIEYEWCEREIIKASKDMGYGKDWKKALEHVKDLYVSPGEQIYMVHELAEEAIEYVEKRDMVTIPQVAEECWRTCMMSPEQQKVSPFFLGGPYIQVSYPMASQSHENKLMIMRGNSKPLSRSTVFHELLPGHHLQYYYMDRFNTHRQPFTTPFWIEGWAFYWEMILWDREFPETPENKIGMLFWRMHRCARIVFSIKFHLGEMTPQECIDYLVDKVGHERATAEGEVRRSFNGDWKPLYQAGYMLGALQLYALRKEIVDTGRMGEKAFHDRILRENNMPIEMLRALLKDERLRADHKPSWRFYNHLREQ